MAKGVYKCDRSSKKKKDEKPVLWLRQMDPAPGDAPAVKWVAYDAPNSDEVPEIGDPIFSSTAANVLENGWHHLILCTPKNQSTGSFESKVLPEGDP